VLRKKGGRWVAERERGKRHPPAGSVGEGQAGGLASPYGAPRIPVLRKKGGRWVAERERGKRHPPAGSVGEGQALSQIFPKFGACNGWTKYSPKPWTFFPTTSRAPEGSIGMIQGSSIQSLLKRA